MRRLLLPFRSKKDREKALAELPTSSSLAEAPAPSPPAPAAGTVQHGLQVVYEGSDPVVDIVAVHGLNGHREKTWTADNGVHWLRDLLPHDLPNARILSWGYDANTHSGSRVSCQYLFDHARTLVSDLCLERQITETSKRPIIFIAHSLGGIIVKSALIHSDAARRGALEEHRSVKLSTYGIVFMGTPHQGGSGVTLGRLMVNVASVLVKADDRLLQHLERDSEWLLQQLGQYGPISGDFVTKYAYETYATPTVLGRSMVVVPRASAVVPGAADGEPIAIHADHIHMVKFGSQSDSGYRTVSGHLQLMATRAGDAIGQRWDTEGRVDAVRSNEVVASFAVQFSMPEVSHVERFVGRQEQLDAIYKELQHIGSRQTVFVHGLGGMGKTQLALAYAQRHRDKYSAVFWVNSKSEDTLKQGYAVAARRICHEHPSLVHLKAVAAGSNLDEAAEAVKRWLSSVGNDRWLVIFDNYDTPKLPGHNESGTFDIRPFLPEAHHGAVLITTRSSQLPLGRPVALKKLQDIEHSLEILSQTSRRDGLNADPDARKLADELDGLPLALATAGAYLHQVSTSFADYLQLYKASWLRLQKKTPQLLSYEDRALYSTWNISLNHVKQQSELAAKLLQLWAYFDNQDVWLELLQAGRKDGPAWLSELVEDQISFDEVIRVLCDHALVEIHAAFKAGSKVSRGYGMHSCVHAWTMYVVNERWDDGLAGLALKCIGLHVPSTHELEYWVTQQRLLRHADRSQGYIVSTLAEQDDDFIMLHAVHKLGDLYADQSKLVDAEEMYKRALKGREVALGPDHTSTLQTVNNLGNVFADLGKLDDAEVMYERALKGYEDAVGRNDASMLDTISNLGVVYAKQGKLAEAEEMFKRACEEKVKTFGPHHTSTLETVNNLGNIHIEQGSLDKAEEMYKRALQGFEGALGPDHTSTLQTVSNLGLLYADQGKLDQAEEMYERALKGRKDALRPDHPSTLETVNNLGLLYVKQGKLVKAEEMYERALRGYEGALGQYHMSTLHVVNNLGRLYADQGKLDQAEEMYERALKGREDALGPDHPSMFETVNNLGLLYANQGKLVEAEEMYEWALKGYEGALGPDHPSTLDTIRNLGLFYTDQGKLAEAEAMFKRALIGCEECYGSDDSRCNSLRRTLATIRERIAFQ